MDDKSLGIRAVIIRLMAVVVSCEINSSIDSCDTILAGIPDTEGLCPLNNWNALHSLEPQMQLVQNDTRETIVLVLDFVSANAIIPTISSKKQFIRSMRPFL